jgi:cell division transport system permease protein
MSGAMTDQRPEDELTAPSRFLRLLSRNDAPIVPKNSIAGRTLVAVIAIMAFLASLTTGAVMLVRTAANEWQSEVAREITIQVRPVEGRDIEAEVGRAVEIARTFPGIAEVRPLSKADSMRLLDPWLGTGLVLDDLPVPRLIVVRVASGAAPNLAKLRQLLIDQVAGANLDDHRAWIDRMRAMAHASVIGGIGILVLMLVATVLSVVFATRGAMATNRPIVEVLHIIGAKDGFIAGQFQRHFLVLGLEGGAIGGGAAIGLFALAGFARDWFLGTNASDQFALLFGTFSIGLEGYIAVLVQIVLIAAVTAATSRQTVNRTLESIE